MSLWDDPYMKRLAGAALHSLFDPNPVRFSRAHRTGIAPIKRMLSKSDPALYQLPRPLLRGQFLYACKVSLESMEVEHLVVGFGHKRGSGTDIHRVAHLVGDEGSVGIPPQLQSLISAHLASGGRPEVVIVHNHPKWWANTLLNNRPAASPEDRELLVAQRYRNPLSLVRVIFRTGGVRLFLVENKKVREIVVPNWSTIVRMFASPT